MLSLALALWHPRSITTLLAILGVGFCGAFSLSVIPRALQLLVGEPAYRNARNIACLFAGAVPAMVTISLLVLITWAALEGFGPGRSVMTGGSGA